METKNGNKQVYPTGDHKGIEPDGGLTRREHFAAMAMQGMVTQSRNWGIPNVNEESMKQSLADMARVRQEQIKAAIDYADELITQLNKKP